MDVVDVVSFGLAGIVRSAERLYECEFCCLGHTRKVSVLCLLYKIYYRVDHFISEYLNHFGAASNSRV